MNYSVLRSLVSEVFDLFPDEVKERTLYQNYYEYLLILKTALPYLQRCKKLLDVGAGGGVIPLVLTKAGYECSAIDTWAEYDRIYHNRMGVKEDILTRLKTNGIEIKFCDIEKEPSPFEDGSFDMVFFLDVIEHIYKPKKVLKEIQRVLASSGILVITTVNLSCLKNRLYMLFGRSNYVELSYWYNSEPFFGHIREYTLQEVERMLKWEGFEIKRAGLSNCLQIPTIKNFRFKPHQLILIMSLYLLATTLVPKFRYQMIIVAQKVE
jgi:2-polyprenyl-3-methyl-5-hydroxy-6-metoxy-1,4-benzoquinol methylase